MNILFGHNIIASYLNSVAKQPTVLDEVKVGKQPTQGIFVVLCIHE